MSDTDTIHHYQQALMRLLAVVCALAGVVKGGQPVVRLSRSVRNQVHRVLLPVESATRRLISYLEQRMAETPPHEPKPGPSVAERSTLGYLSRNRRKPKRKRGGKRTGPYPAVFWLFDKAQYCPFSADPHRRPPRGGPGPRIWCFDGSDPPRDPVIEKPLRDPDDARKLCRRMLAVIGALDDLPGHAARLRRILDRRRDEPRKPGRTSPMRKGLAPGYRPSRPHEVDQLLYQCNLLASEPVPPGR